MPLERALQMTKPWIVGDKPQFDPMDLTFMSLELDDREVADIILHDVHLLHWELSRLDRHRDPRLGNTQQPP